MIDGSTQLHCFAGCDSDEVLAAMALSWKSIRVARTRPARSPLSEMEAKRAERPRAADAIRRLSTDQAGSAHETVRAVGGFTLSTGLRMISP
jgi:hypothetical protein